MNWFDWRVSPEKDKSRHYPADYAMIHYFADVMLCTSYKLHHDWKMMGTRRVQWVQARFEFKNFKFFLSVFFFWSFGLQTSWYVNFFQYPSIWLCNNPIIQRKNYKINKYSKNALMHLSLNLVITWSKFPSSTTFLAASQFSTQTCCKYAYFRCDTFVFSKYVATSPVIY
jgi:hypothetical protein